MDSSLVIIKGQRLYKFDGPKDTFLVRVENEDFVENPPRIIPPSIECDPNKIDLRIFVPLPFYNATRWDKIENAILEVFLPEFTLEQLPTVIRWYSGKLRCSALRTVLNDETFSTFIPDEDGQWEVVGGMLELIRRIARLALSIKELFPQPIPLLSRFTSSSLTLSQLQCACLLANAFFCTFPEEIREDFPNKYRFNHINFDRIFHLGSIENIAKLKCILYYFYKVTKNMPCGTVTILRTSLKMTPLWHLDEGPLMNLTVRQSGVIEEAEGMTQVDFANKYIGGGVLGLGSVQEEIRFITCPEMIISCLVCEKMSFTESIRIIGAETYSNYEGYSETFTWKSRPTPSVVPRDEYGRFKCELLAIDATYYRNYYDQFQSSAIRRELTKAYCGFCFVTNVSAGTDIATGNWGCGAFNGDRQLKSMIQYLAASRAKRNLVYYPFGETEFGERLNEVVCALRKANITIYLLYRWLLLYEKYCNSDKKLFDYIMEQLDNREKAKEANSARPYWLPDSKATDV